MIDRRSVLASLLAMSLMPPGVRAESNATLETIADGLDRPWSFAFLPEGAILVTERTGNLRTIGTDRSCSAVAGSAVTIWAHRRPAVLKALEEATIATA